MMRNSPKLIGGTTKFGAALLAKTPELFESFLHGTDRTIAVVENFAESRVVAYVSAMAMAPAVQLAFAWVAIPTLSAYGLLYAMAPEQGFVDRNLDVEELFAGDDPFEVAATESTLYRLARCMASFLPPLSPQQERIAEGLPDLFRRKYWNEQILFQRRRRKSNKSSNKSLRKSRRTGGLKSRRRSKSRSRRKSRRSRRTYRSSRRNSKSNCIRKSRGNSKK